MSYYPKPDSHIRDKFKAVLDLTNYANTKELEHATGTDTFDLAVKKILLFLKLNLINWTSIK